MVTIASLNWATASSEITLTQNDQMEQVCFNG